MGGLRDRDGSGVTPVETQVLETLRRVGGYVTPGELAYQLRRRTGITPARIQVALAGLERAGLITLTSRGAQATRETRA